MNRELAKQIVKRTFERGVTEIDEWAALDIFASDYTLHKVGEQPRLPYVRKMWGFGEEKNVNFITISATRNTLMGHETLVGAIWSIFSTTKLKDAIIRKCKEDFTSPLRFAICDTANELTNKYSSEDLSIHFDMYDVCECLVCDSEDDFVKNFISCELKRKGYSEEKVEELINNKNVEELSRFLAIVKNDVAQTLFEWGKELEVGKEICVVNAADENDIAYLKMVEIAEKEVVLVHNAKIFDIVEILYEGMQGDELWVLKK